MIRGNDNERTEQMSKTSKVTRQKMCTTHWNPGKDVGGQHVGQKIDFYHFKDPG